MTSTWPPFLCTWLWQHAASNGTMEEKKVFRVRCGKRRNGRVESGWWWWWSFTKIASLSKVGNVEFILLIKSNLLWTVTQDPAGANGYLIILFGNSAGLWVRSPAPGPGWAALCTALGESVHISMVHLPPCKYGFNNTYPLDSCKENRRQLYKSSQLCVWHRVRCPRSVCGISKVLSHSGWLLDLTASLWSYQ